MRIVTSKELSSFKILPFDLYNEANCKVLGAGEVLTPGKLIMLRNYPKLLTEDLDETNSKNGRTSSGKGALRKLAGFSFNTLDTEDFETVINNDNVLKADFQVRIKYYFKKTLDLFMQGYYEEGLLKLNSLVSVLVSDTFKQLCKSKKGSQVRFLGEYEICHPLNTAIVSGLLAKRLDYTNPEIEDVVLSGLLHDIGKLKIFLADQSPLLSVNEEDVAEHTTIGYEIIKNELNLPEKIAKVSLEHHENNDGSGYPQGISNDYISEYAQIVNVANYYDNLACNRTSCHVSCNRDALRAMLEVGTCRFSARMLYTFVHMFSYDDIKDFNNMIV